MTILILDCDLDLPPENTALIMKQILSDAQIVDIKNNEIPDSLDKYAGFIITGSKANTDDSYQWIGPLKELILKMRSTKKPLLGVCFGHQILAETLGGQVEHSGQHEFGYLAVNLAEDCELFNGIDDQFFTFESHGDIVTKLPPGAHAIAWNSYSNQGFNLDKVYGIQFHPEIDEDLARRMANKHIRDLPEPGVKSIRMIVEENKVIFENFKRMCQKR